MKEKIYIKDWLTLKPYVNQAPSDIFYLQLSNRLKSAITKNINAITLKQFFLDSLNLYVCFITSYLEDLISETNLWNTFVKIHKRMYGFQVPFYDLSEYYEDEINLQDVQFLTWYFLNTAYIETEILPNDDIIVSISAVVMDILDDAWDDAPENKNLKAAYQLNDTAEDDFEAIQNLMDNILYQSYLFFIDTGERLVHTVKNKVEEEQLDEVGLVIISSEINDIITFTENTLLLALQGKIWAAELLGNHRLLSQNLINLSDRYSGHFYYKGKDEHHYFFEHSLSGTKFNFNKIDFKYDKYLRREGQQFLLTFFQWKNKYISTKFPIENEMSKSEIIERKSIYIDMEASLFVIHEKDKIEAILNDQLNAFCNFNNGHQIAFMLSNVVKEYLNNFYNYYYNKFSKLQNHNSQFCIKDNLTCFEENIEDDLPILVFFNPKRGIEIQQDINSAFPFAHNPFFDEEDSEDDFKYMIEIAGVSPELVEFCVKHGKDKLPFFTTDYNKIYFKNLGFIHRFYTYRKYTEFPYVAYKN